MLKDHNPNWLQIPDHPYRILIVSGSGKTNYSIIYQPDLDKIYMLKIHMMKNTIFQLKNKKVLALSILKIQKLLLNTQMVSMIFIKSLKNTIKIKNEKY